jgi:environmental stress-induced protein Ves
MDGLRLTPLPPGDYRRTPWKNGGGTTTDIAGASDEAGEVWRFGRTPIVAAGPFSDYAGFDRLQVVVAGRGLVLQTPTGAIDVRTPFRPVRFAGETPIVSRLVNGPVEVVNLIGRRAAVRLDLRIAAEGQAMAMAPGIHLVYAADGPARLELAGQAMALAADHALRLDAERPAVLTCRQGRAIVASVMTAEGR